MRRFLLTLLAATVLAALPAGAPLAQSRQEVLLQACRNARLAGNSEAALGYYEQVLEANPELAHVRREYGWYLFELGRKEAAARELESVVQARPQDSGLRRELADLYLNLGRGGEAASHLEAALEMEPRNGAALEKLAELYEAHQDYAAAKAAWRRLLALRPGDLKLHRRYLSMLEAAGSHAEAAAEAEAILELAPGDRRASLCLARALVAQGRFGEAREAVGRKDYLTILYEGRLWEEFAAQAEGYLEGRPDDGKLRGRLIEVYLSLSRFAEAERHLRAALARGARNKATRFRLAQVLEWQKKYQEAARELAALLKERPDRADLRLELAKVLLYGGRVKEAIPHLEALLAQGDSPEAQALYLQALAWAGRPREAQGRLRGLPDEARNASIRLLEADLLREDMEWHKAWVIYEALLAEEPGCWQAHFGLARIYEHFGLWPECLASLRLALQGNPNDPHVQAAYVLALAATEEATQAHQELARLASVVPGALFKLTRAQLLSLEGSQFAAARQFESILSEEPGQLAAALGLIECQKALLAWAAALKACQTALEHHPESLRARLEEAGLLIITRQWAEAEERLEVILEEHPANFEARYLLVRIHSCRHRAEAAGQATAALISRVRQDLEANASLALGEGLWLARRLVEDRNHLQAVALCQALLQAHPERGELLAVYVGAARKCLRTDEAQAHLGGLLETHPESPALSTFLAEIRATRGETGKATCGNPGPARENEDLAGGDFEPALKLALARRLADDECSGDESCLKLACELADAAAEDEEFFLDSALLKARALARAGRYPEAVAAYQEVTRRAAAQAPIACLELARVQSWDHLAEESVATYEAYLELNPFDLAARREKARVYGWNLEYEMAAAEYERLLAADPEAAGVRLERAAKACFWEERHQEADGLYEGLLELEPHNLEARFDRGQIYCQAAMPADAGRAYQDLLHVLPGHQAAQFALGRERLYRHPWVRLGYGYVDQRGYDDLVSISYHEARAATGLYVAPQVEVAAEYARTFFGFSDFADFAADSYRLSARWRPSLAFGLTGFAAARSYHRVDEANANFGLEGRYDWSDYAGASLAYSRLDFWENAYTVSQNLYEDRVSAHLYLTPSRRWDLGLGGSWGRVSDGNDRWATDLLASYEASLYPRILKVLYRFDGVGYAEQKPYTEADWDRIDPGNLRGVDLDELISRRRSHYFAPGAYFRNGLALEWRHYLGREHLCESKRLYYSLLYGPWVDSDGRLFSEVRAEAGWDVTSRLNLSGWGSYLTGTVYDERRAGASLTGRL